MSEHTHSTDCWRWHHGCAVKRLETARGYAWAMRVICNAHGAGPGAIESWDRMLRIIDGIESDPFHGLNGTEKAPEANPGGQSGAGEGEAG